MSTTTYVFFEKYERDRHFSDEKSALSVAMCTCLKVHYLTLWLTSSIWSLELYPILTAGFDSRAKACLCVLYLSCTILSAPIAVSNIVLYFWHSSLIGFVRLPDAVLVHRSLNCSFNCVSDFSSSSSWLIHWNGKTKWPTWDYNISTHTKPASITTEQSV